ncbi:hypothetical protein KFU94_08150 [Chloroflexi bacterium TSY]|nr:hypothetical protein [Chloroflexi bacterium TSY]
MQHDVLVAPVSYIFALTKEEILDVVGNCPPTDSHSVTVMYFINRGLITHDFITANVVSMRISITACNGRIVVTAANMAGGDRADILICLVAAEGHIFYYFLFVLLLSTLWTKHSEMDEKMAMEIEIQVDLKLGKWLWLVFNIV